MKPAESTPAIRFQGQRIWLIEQIVRRIIIPLAGRGVQVIRQDARSGGAHHAPLCGANHYHHTIPVTRRCTCGAVEDSVVLEAADLKELVVHCWLHNGYEDCGFRKMTTEQRTLYDRVIGREHCPTCDAVLDPTDSEGTQNG